MPKAKLLLGYLMSPDYRLGDLKTFLRCLFCVILYNKFFLKYHIFYDVKYF